MDAILETENEKPDSLTEIVVPESQNYELKVKYGFRRSFARGFRSPAALILYTVFAMSESLFLIGADYFSKYNVPIEPKPFLISSTIAGVTTLVAFTYYYGRQLLERERHGEDIPFQKTLTERIVTCLLDSTRVRDRD